MKIFGKEHLIVSIVFIVVSVVSLILSKKYLKTDKQQKIYIRIIAALILFTVTVNRISLSRREGIEYILPTSLCGLTSFLFSISVIFGKPKMNAYFCFFYMALGGGLATLIYPDFFVQTTNFFQLNICTGWLHHALCVLLCMTMCMFGWFRPELKKCYYFPLLFCIYIVVGSFEYHVLDIYAAMDLAEPLLSGTPLNAWFIWVVASVLVAVISAIYELIVKYLKKRKTAKAVICDENN